MLPGTKELTPKTFNVSAEHDTYVRLFDYLLANGASTETESSLTKNLKK